VHFIESFIAYLGSITGSVGPGYVAEQFSISLARTVAGAILVVSLALYLRADAGRKREGYVQKAPVLETS